MPICIGVGALLLWKRTRRVAALLQLIAAVVFLLGSVLDVLPSYVDPHHRSWLSKLVWSPNVSEQKAAIMLIAMSVFAISYLWFALSRRNI